MDESVNELPNTNIKIIRNIKRRRDLLPWWVKVFTWMFLLFGVMVPVGVVVGALGISFNLNLFGLQTNEPFSAIGLLLMAIFAFKGVVAYGLWFEKDWAVTLARLDAILTILICAALMGYDLMHIRLNFRLELVVAIPYYLKMGNIQTLWQQFGQSQPEPVIHTNEM